MAALVAKWAIPAAEQAQNGATKARATKAEMAERSEVTRWLIETAGRPLSRRGVAYRAEALLDLPKTVKAFRYIEEETLTLRDNGLIPWEMVRDGRRQMIPHGRRRSLAEHVRYEARDHRLDLWVNTEVQAHVGIEKEDLADALSERARGLGLDVYPASGFTGAGFLREAIKQASYDPRPLVLFLFVDYDSSGNVMRETIERRARRFAAELGVEIEGFVDVALTREQVDDNNLPTRPQKKSTHTRADDDTDAAELDAVDALYPDLLGDWLEEAIEPYCPAAHREAVHGQEERNRGVLTGVADKLTDELEEG
jgi:hypothetical protein